MTGILLVYHKFIAYHWDEGAADGNNGILLRIGDSLSTFLDLIPSLQDDKVNQRIIFPDKS